MLEAEGEAEAIRLRALASADALHTMAEALGCAKGQEAAVLSLAKDYVAMYGEMGAKSNTMLFQVIMMRNGGMEKGALRWLLRLSVFALRPCFVRTLVWVACHRTGPRTQALCWRRLRRCCRQRSRRALARASKAKASKSKARKARASKWRRGCRQALS